MGKPHSCPVLPLLFLPLLPAHISEYGGGGDENLFPSPGAEENKIRTGVRKRDLKRRRRRRKGMQKEAPNSPPPPKTTFAHSPVAVLVLAHRRFPPSHRPDNIIPVPHSKRRRQRIRMYIFLLLLFLRRRRASRGGGGQFGKRSQVLSIKAD